jgi:hypothetical protein
MWCATADQGPHDTVIPIDDNSSSRRHLSPIGRQSSATQGSLPTTHASCPASAANPWAWADLDLDALAASHHHAPAEDVADVALGGPTCRRGHVNRPSPSGPVGGVPDNDLAQQLHRDAHTAVEKSHSAIGLLDRLHLWPDAFTVHGRELTRLPPLRRPCRRTRRSSCLAISRCLRCIRTGLGHRGRGPGAVLSAAVVVSDVS